MAIFSKRVGQGLLVVLLLVITFLMLWDPMSALTQAPPPDKEYDVEIIRDDYGVPHIYGKTDADVAYGIAYAHAEDDFSTIEEVTAMTRARLGAMTGSAGAATDYVAHLMDIRGTVDRKYDALPADVRALFDGYAVGLNHYAKTHSAEVRLPNLFPVNGKDIAAGFALRSPFFFGLQNTLGPLTEGEKLVKDGGPALDMAKEAAYAPNISPVGPDAASNGSNAFVVAPSRSKDGKTRLISNSHQPWRGGVAWYELVVHSEEGWDFAGATFPGSPYPFLGHNKYLGWTNTVNRPDLIDVYELELDETGLKYRIDGEWKDLESERVWLRVRFGPFVIPYPQAVWRSEHGPVIKNARGAFAVRYAGIDDLGMLEQYYRINKAKNFDEWKAAMALQGVPATNFIYADAEGNIALVYNALFPDRKEGVDWRDVVPGNRSDLIWKGPVAWDKIPFLTNPASGYIMNANNTPYVAAGPGDELDPENYSPLLGVENDMTNRARRAIKLLEEVGQIGDEELYRIKYDTVYENAGYSGAWFAKIAALDLSDDPELAKAQKLLSNWDWNLDGNGAADALALIILRPANSAHYNRKGKPDPREELSKAAAHLTKYFGRIDPPMQEILRLRQGDVDLPMDGGNDTLRASTLWDVHDDGKLSIYHGDSFIQFVEWAADGSFVSRSIQPFGSATTRPESPHHTDQAKLFVEKKTKPVYFSRESLEGHISRKYRP